MAMPPLYMIVKCEGKHLHIEDITLPAWFTRGLPEDKYMYFECTLRYSNVACWKIQDLIRWFSHDSHHFQHHETTFSFITGGFSMGFSMGAFSMMKSLSILWDFSWSSLGYRLKPWWFWDILSIGSPIATVNSVTRGHSWNLGRP